MSSKNLEIHIDSKYDGTGVASAKADVTDFGRAVNTFARGTTGPLKRVLGLIKDIATGGIWQIGASAIMAAGAYIAKFWRSTAEEAKKASEAIKKSADEIKASVAEIDKSFSSGVSSVDKYTSRLEKQIDTTKRLAIAEKELEKQRALASGDNMGAAKADEDIAVIAAKSEEAKEAARVQGYEQRRKLAAEAERKAEKELNKATAEVDKINARRQAMLGDPGRRGDHSLKYTEGDESVWGKANASAIYQRNIWRRSPQFRDVSNAELDDMAKRLRDKTFQEGRKQLYKSDEWKRSNDDLAKATEASIAASDTLFKMRQALAEIDTDEKRRLEENAAKKKEAEAKAVADNFAAEQKAVEDVAKERERLDRELHQKRMADLREEIAAQKEAATPLQAVAAQAKTEFERAFAMYRSPERAKAEIDEEKDRAEDLKRLHKDASRYGGKWRIDELSALMSAGDTAGVQSRLEEWRKSRSFTPEVEAMVRASAAEKTQTTVEDELRKLNEKTEQLTQTISQLSQTRDGKLDGIERNTSNLAGKVQELLGMRN